MTRRSAVYRYSVPLCAAALLLLPTTAVAAYGPKSGVYGGKASGRSGANPVHPVSLIPSRDGKKIATLRMTALAVCSKSGAYDSPARWTGVKIARNGAFSDSDKSVQRSTDGSEVITWSSELQGRLTASGGSGKYRDVATIRDRKGNFVQRCDTGLVRFKPARGRRVFGGSVNLGSGHPGSAAGTP